MNSLILNILLWLFSVFVSSVSQTLLKISANKEYPDRLHEYLNPYVIADTEGKDQQKKDSGNLYHPDRNADLCSGENIRDLTRSYEICAFMKTLSMAGQRRPCRGR